MMRSNSLGTADEDVDEDVDKDGDDTGDDGGGDKGKARASSDRLEASTLWRTVAPNLASFWRILGASRYLLNREARESKEEATKLKGNCLVFCGSFK